LPNQNENNANGVVAWTAGSTACGRCKDRWAISWQITPRVLTDALAGGGAEAKRAFAAMMDMGKIDIAIIEAARHGWVVEKFGLEFCLAS
jgi:predicted 3-demethylubiquinone-9 3-methyltransferase (glyoxalase superfamily)